MSQTDSCLACFTKDNVLDIWETYLCNDIQEVYTDMLEFTFNISLKELQTMKSMCLNCVYILRDAFYFKQKIVRNVDAIRKLTKIDKPESGINTNTEKHNIEVVESNNEKVLGSEFNIEGVIVSYGTEVLKSKSYGKEVIETNGEEVIETNGEEVIETNGEEVLESNSVTEDNNSWYIITNTDENDGKKQIENDDFDNGDQSGLDGEEEIVEVNDLHAKLENEKQTDYSIQISEKTKRYPCSVCDKMFYTKLAVNRHLVTHRNGPFPCDLCGQVFNKINSRNGHKWRVHSVRNTYLCSCGARFPTYHARLRHEKQDHSKEPNYPCPECNKVYYSAGERSTHVKRTHLHLRGHKCSHCVSSFFKKRELDSHLASVHGVGEMRYGCCRCGKRFFKRSTLKCHVKLHSERHRCDICSKVCISSKSLKDHIKIHEGQLTADVRNDFNLEHGLENAYDADDITRKANCDVIVEPSIVDISNEAVYYEICNL